MNSFNHYNDFMCFVTESHAVLLALKVTGLTDVSDVRPPAIHDLQKFMKHTSQLVVDHAWLMPPLAAVKDVAKQLMTTAAASALKVSLSHVTSNCIMYTCFIIVIFN